MRCFVFRLLAACVLALPMAAGSAGAQDAKSSVNSSNVGQLFAAETPASVMFDDGEVVLDADALARLDRQAAWIASHNAMHVRVYGITSQKGYPPRNMAMAMKRANAVVQYLVSKGVNPAHLEAVVLLGNAPRPSFADAGASTFTEISLMPTSNGGAAGGTS